MQFPMQDKGMRKVLWLTNLPAPYRFPIWKKLADELDLTVSFLLDEKNWRNWEVPPDVRWTFVFLSLRSKRFREFDIIPSIRGAKTQIEGKELLILGGWETPFYLYTLRLARKKKIPVIQFYESTLDSHNFNNFLVRKIRFFVFSQADYIVTAGTASTNAVKAMGIAQEKIITLFNPVDVSWFYAASKKYHILDSPGHRFIYVGQLIDRKNVAMLLRAFSAIRNEADTLTIVGDGPAGGVLKNLADSLGISDSVIFIGHKSQDELAALYGESNTLVLPSVNEVWGLVVNEALASGLHAVISDKCGVANLASNMQGAYIFPIEQKSLQEAMRRSANEWSGHIENPEILRYTPEKFADELLSVIRNVKRISKPDLIWLTNIPTPYRIPLWEVLNSRLSFSLLLLSRTEKGRKWNFEERILYLPHKYLKVKAYYLFQEIPLYLNFRKVVRALRALQGSHLYIDGWESPSFFLSAFYAKRKGSKVIYGYRSTLDSHNFNNFLVRKIRFFVFSQADYIVTAGTASTNAVKAMGIAQEKIITLFNPVDVSWFYAASKKYHILDSPGHRFIYVGQLIDRKNVAMLLRAFSAIRNEADTLTIVGDGPAGGVLKNLADSLGISDSVIFIGHKSQDELAALYGESNTLVLPSVNEVWGLVVNEALASGLHAVISDKCGVANLASNMQGAYIFPIEQKSLQEAMRRSANEWSGHIENPEILRYTPEKFADELLIRIGFVDGGTK